MSTNTADLKKFAQTARRELREQVAGRLEQVLRTDSAELREKEAALRELREQIALTSKKAVIDRVAYTWFNRFCALRFMDANHYTRMGVVSPAEGLSQPEILQEAKNGYIDEDLKSLLDAKAVIELLNGQRPSSDPQSEAYRLLLVAVCNFYNAAMPFLFEKIADYTELLMPLDLLSEHAVLHTLRSALDAEACQDVEVIGWLYQYYISERKDEVFEALKANQKIEAADIPAATQLFTPHWIVRYLVENSLGRLWMLNHPESRLAGQMEYYIKPVQQEADFLHVASPEELKICDPACGSGHMLTYAFDLLYAIYEESGYPAAEIPKLILQKNLYGIEIDPRAGGLAAFALTMKARARDRRFFARDVQPNICVLENVIFTDQELDEYIHSVGNNLFTTPLRETLRQFEQAESYGSLIRPVLVDAAFVRGMLENKQPGLFLHHIHEKTLKVLRFAEFLSPRYQIVVANPPYMGSRNMNEDFKEFANNSYPISKSDLFAMFIERVQEIGMQKSLLGFVTPFVWMFLSSYENLRKNILANTTISSLVQLEYNAYAPAVIPACVYILENWHRRNYKGSYIRLSDFKGSENQAPRTLEAIKKPNCGWFYNASIADFTKIPGTPIVYWIDDVVKEIFFNNPAMGDVVDAKQGLSTGDDDLFLRLWWEVSFRSINFLANSRDSAKNSQKKWFPYNKGGIYRKWFGNQEYIINWKNDGQELFDFRPKSVIRNPNYFFKPTVSWSDITTNSNAFRAYPAGFIFDTSRHSAFPNANCTQEQLLSFCNSKLASHISAMINPSFHFSTGYFQYLPAAFLPQETIDPIITKLISLSREDWNSYETSVGFLSFSKLEIRDHFQEISIFYKQLRTKWHQMMVEAQWLEIENNRIFIESYGLKNTLTSEVPLNEITLICNPYYRYPGDRRKTNTESELESLLLSDSIKEFISYAIGCMFGRYSLDKPGLVLANQGETMQDYLRQVPESSFLPDEDNVIPVLDGDWFSDDITERFKKFLRVTFGDEHYSENLAFIEEAIGRDIRSYFVKEFYKEHLQMYKKRPIYWMFSSPKGSFNVLVYMHRYKPDTVSVILNKYLREFRGKLEARKAYLEQVSISASASPREKTSALKEIENLNKILEELRAYERDVLYPLATQRLEIDLDDGVKVNYGKFGSALQKIVGL